MQNPKLHNDNNIVRNTKMPAVFLQQRERFREATLKRLGVSGELFDQFNRTLAPHVQQVRFRKGEYLQHAGKPATAGFWLFSGVGRRGLIASDGTDVTMGFATDGEPCGSHHDLLAGEQGLPALEFVVAESAITAARFEWTTIVRLREQHEFMREYYLKVAEYSLRRYSQSCYMRSMTSAADRLQTFRQQHPGLEARISQKALASFLGITPQYMSMLLRSARIRGESAGTDKPA